MTAQRPTRKQFWNEIFPHNEPVVWRGAVSDLEVVELARNGVEPLMDRLVCDAGDSEVHVTAAPPHAGGKMGFSPVRWADWSRRGTTLRAFASELSREQVHPSGHCMYMQSAPIASALPELLPLTPLWLSDEERMCAESRQLWIGSGGQRLAIHQDATHSVLCMVSGYKELILFPPDQHPNLYTAPQQNLFEWPWRSVVDPRAPDLERYPRFSEALAHARRIRIGPGDALFLPAYWWHSVDSFGLNVMFNSRWLDVPAERLNATTGAFAHVVSTARKLEASNVDELQRRIELAFSTGPLDDDARRSVRDDLCRALTEPRAPNAIESDTSTQTRVLRRDCSATMVEGGLSLRSASSGKCFTLGWDFAPILSMFTSPTSPASALNELQREFDVDAAEFMEQVIGLSVAGVLSPADPPRTEAAHAADATRIQAAVAHATLAVAGLPDHHKDATWLSLRMFAFGEFGDQYADLEPDQRGVLGHPCTEASTKQLEAIATASLRKRYGVGLVPEDIWSGHYRLDPGRHFSLTTDGLVPTAESSEQTPPLQWEQVELLAAFRTPNTPAAAFEEARLHWDVTREDFRTLVEGWIASGTLVEHPTTAPTAPRGDASDRRPTPDAVRCA